MSFGIILDLKINNKPWYSKLLFNTRNILNNKTKRISVIPTKRDQNNTWGYSNGIKFKRKTNMIINKRYQMHDVQGMGRKHKSSDNDTHNTDILSIYNANLFKLTVN